MAGGFIPVDLRGTASSALIATADWLATFASLAGVDPADTRAAAHGLPPIDSVDQSPVLFAAAGHAYRAAAAGMANARQDIVLGGLLSEAGNGHAQPPTPSVLLVAARTLDAMGQSWSTLSLR